MHFETYSRSAIYKSTTKQSFKIDINNTDESTFGARLRKCRIEKKLYIEDISRLCNVTKSVISGYELNRYMPSKYVLDKLSEEFDMDYLCRDGYTRILFNFDIFLNTLSKWMDDNGYSKNHASCILGVSPSLIRFWYNGTVIRKKTYDKIETNLIKYNLIK